MSRRARRTLIIAVTTVFALVVAFFAAWGIDSSRSSGAVPRNVGLLGRDIGGLDAAQLSRATTEVAEQYRGASVRITSPAGTLETTAGAVGLQLDPVATQQAILAVDQARPAWRKPFAWARSLVQPQTAPVVFTVDPAVTAAGLAPLAAANLVVPTEPTIAATDQAIVPVAGVAGHAIDPNAVATQLLAAASAGSTPVIVDVSPSPTRPTRTDGEAKALAEKANAISRNPLALSVGGKSATITSKVLRSWITAVPGPDGLQLGADQAKIVAELPTFVADLGTAPVDTTFTLVDDKVQIVDGQGGTRCCAPNSAARIAQALVAGQTTVALDLEPVPPAHDRAWAEGQKVVEQVATFTTRHPAGEPRVVNIHKIADTVRGMYIEPGQEFSLNQRVGQRTKEKGYVEAPVIYDATHDTDVGGGVSQFATTTFNAAFFGGLDFVDYQSHSLAIDRYPYGREATISWPKPDLVIRNNTPYGIMIWTSYTDTSLTVSLWSTTFAKGEQTNQTKEPKGPCTRVTTERTRTFVSDGHTEVDKVYALYQPADGVKCP